MFYKLYPLPTAEYIMVRQNCSVCVPSPAIPISWSHLSVIHHHHCLLDNEIQFWWGWEVSPAIVLIPHQSIGSCRPKASCAKFKAFGKSNQISPIRACLPTLTTVSGELLTPFPPGHALTTLLPWLQAPLTISGLFWHNSVTIRPHSH